MENKKWFKIFGIAAIITGFVFSGYVVLADTGFDIDYDFGGSGGGGGFDFGSGGGGFDFGSGGGFGFGSGSSLNSNAYLMILLIIVGITILFEVIKRNTGKGREEDQKKIKPNDSTTNCCIWYDDVENIIPGFNKKEFNKLACEMYVKLQEAWMNFDYETIRSLTTDDLYNSYKTMLESLERKKQKNIVSDIKVYGCNFTNAENEHGKYTVEVELDLAYRDYIVQEKNNDYELVRGVVNRLDVVCLITLISTEKKETSTCPVCGGPISKNNQSDKCKFCGNTIVKENYNWLISKKEIVSQKIIKE